VHCSNASVAAAVTEVLLSVVFVFVAVAVALVVEK
jgi:hypothetical protein